MLSSQARILNGKSEFFSIEGIRGSCNDDFKTTTAVRLGYHFTTHEYRDGKHEYIHLEGGPTGYESCEWNALLKWARSITTRLKEIFGKNACGGQTSARNRSSRNLHRRAKIFPLASLVAMLLVGIASRFPRRKYGG